MSTATLITMMILRNLFIAAALLPMGTPICGMSGTLSPCGYYWFSWIIILPAVAAGQGQNLWLNLLRYYCKINWGHVDVRCGHPVKRKMVSLITIRLRSFLTMIRRISFLAVFRTDGNNSWRNRPAGSYMSVSFSLHLKRIGFFSKILSLFARFFVVAIQVGVVNTLVLWWGRQL